MNRMRIWVFIVSWMFVAVLKGQTSHRWLREGDEQYEKKQLPDSENAYRKSLAKRNTSQGHYNLGNTLYKQNRYEEALAHYRSALKDAKEDYQKSQAYHNLGNAYFRTQQLDKSIEAYKNALRINSNDSETKINLALAQKLKKQQEQKQQQQNKDQNKDQNQNQNQQNQQNQQQQQQNQQQQNQQQQSQNQQNQQQQNPQQAQAPKNLNRKEAENLLNIMEQEERKVQGKLKRMPGQRRNEKDW